VLCSIIGPGLVYAQYEVRSSISGVTVDRRYDERELQTVYQWININPLRKSSLSLDWIIRYINSTGFPDEEITEQSSSISLEVSKNLTGYALICSGDQISICQEQLDLIEPRFFTLRSEAIARGLAEIRNFLDIEIDSLRQLQASTTDTTQINGLRLYELDVVAQLTMLDRLEQEGAFSLDFIKETSRPQWDFVQTTSSYIASSVVAALIGLLIVLQLALKPPRSPRLGPTTQQEREPS
jgi:hypothetical protein